MVYRFKNALNKKIFEQIPNCEFISFQKRIWFVNPSSKKWYFFYDMLNDKFLWNENEFETILKIFTSSSQNINSITIKFIADLFSNLNKSIIGESLNNKSELLSESFIGIHVSTFDLNFYETLKNGKILSLPQY